MRNSCNCNISIASSIWCKNAKKKAFHKLTIMFLLIWILNYFLYTMNLSLMQKLIFTRRNDHHWISGYMYMCYIWRYCSAICLLFFNDYYRMFSLVNTYVKNAVSEFSMLKSHEKLARNLRLVNAFWRFRFNVDLPLMLTKDYHKPYWWSDIVTLLLARVIS